VEAVLAQQENVLGAVAVAHGDILVAYITPEDVDVRSVTNQLKRTLPAYMVPSIIMPLDDFPLTTNQKVDRKALPAPDIFDIGVRYAAPTTPEEAAMCTTWEALFGLDHVGVYDAFFALGGHSLLAMQLSHQTPYSVSTIMANPTVSQLVHAETGSGALMIPASSTAQMMSKVEQRMLYIHLQDPSSTNYHVPFKIQFDEGIDVENELRKLIASEPILRTRFVDGRATCDVDVSIELEDSCDVWAPFDMLKGPLCRFSIKDNVLTGCAHHSIFDGRSVQLLMQRLVNLSIALPRRTVRDYAAWEAEQAVDGDGWVSILGDTPPRFECSGSQITHVSTLVVDAETVERILSWCSDRRVSPFVFAMYVTRQVLWAYSHEPFALGIAHDVRPAECQDAMGMFVNTVLIPFGEVGEKVDEVQHRWVHEILPRARTPYDEIVKLGYGSNVYLAYNVGFGGTIAKARVLPVDDEVVPDAKFDLTFEWVDGEAGSWVVSMD